MAEEGKAKLWPDGAEKVENIGDFEFLMAGRNNEPVLKIEKEKLNEFIVVNGEGVKAVAGGATSANPTILSPGPTGANRKMEDVEGWFVNGTADEPPVATGVAWEAPTGKKNTNWWDGTNWSLGSSVPLPTPTGVDVIDPTGDALPKEKAVANYADLEDSNVLSLSKVIKIPYDKTDMVFNNTSLNPSSNYYESSMILKKGEVVGNLYVKADISGNVAVGFYKITGTTAQLLHSVQLPVMAGLNNLDFSTVNIPYDTFNSDAQVTIRPIESGVLKLNNSVASTGGVITGTTILLINTVTYPYWMVKKHVLEFYPDTKKEVSKISNMQGETGNINIPYDKSGISPTSTGADTFYFSSKDAVLGMSDNIKSIKYYSRNNGGQFRVRLVNMINNSVVYTSDPITSPGLGIQTINISSLTPAFPTTRTADLQIFVGNEVTASGPIGFKGVSAGTGEAYYAMNKSSGAITNNPVSTSVVILAYWIVKEGMVYTPIVGEVKSLQAALSLKASDVTEILNAFNTNDVVTLKGNIVLDRTLVMPEGKTLLGSGRTILTLAPGVTKGILVQNNYVVLDGFIVDGSSPQLDIIGTTILPTADGLETLVGNGTRVGIHFYKTKGSTARSVTARNLNSFGFHIEDVGTDATNPAEYGFDLGVNLDSCVGINAYAGVRTSNKGEYSRFTNFKAINCISGASIASGNITVVNGQFENNRVNSHVGSGANNAHGSFVGGTMNHAKLRGLYVHGITNGHVFNGINFFAGAIEIYDSIGVNINGGFIASAIYATLNANQAANIANNGFRFGGPDGSGNFTKTGSGKLYRSGNYYANGADSSSINGTL